jgi:hypothetical protein
MPRPKDKTQLLELSQQNFEKLLDLVSQLDAKAIEKTGACEEWSVKDILAHLHAWHLMALEWHKKGMKEGKADFLPEGFTWKDTPKLNEEIYQKYKDSNFQDTLKKFKDSHKDITNVIQKHTDKELFTKKYYKFTGSTSLGAYLISATSSHYDWAISLIKKLS